MQRRDALDRGLRFLAATGVAVALLAGGQLRGAAQEESDGRELFGTTCASCHGVAGEGKPGEYPPLAGNERATDVEYVLQTINEGKRGPIEVDGQTYDAEMKPFDYLPEAERAAIAEYVATELAPEGADPQPAPSPTQAPIEGDPAGGEALFTGREDLVNGGTACVACHTAGSHGGFGQGWSAGAPRSALAATTMGPDLTDLAERLGGEEAVTRMLANPPSPVMQPIFAQNPMTDQERADLAAYLAQEAPTQPVPTGPDWFLVMGVAGFVALMALTALLARTRHTHYLERRPHGRRPGSART